MKLHNILFLLLVLISFISCNDFLDKAPSKSNGIIVKNTAILNDMLNNYQRGAIEQNMASLFYSDDFGFTKDLVDKKGIGWYIVKVARAAVWDNTQTSRQSSCMPVLWQDVYNVNFILEQLENSKVIGTEAVKEQLRAECHFIRAYYYYQLISTFCLPYCPDNYSSQGLGIKKTTSNTESIKRASLKETWDFMKSDLNFALDSDHGVKSDLIKSKLGIYNNYRATKPAVNALAARIALVEGRYKEAAYFANKAISEHGSMIDFNEKVMFAAAEDVRKPRAEGGGVEKIMMPSTHTNSNYSPFLKWDELLYFDVLGIPISSNLIPSKELLSIYNKDYDLRYKYFFVKHYSYKTGANIDWPFYFQFNMGCIYGPTTAEMHLIKAECSARLGDVTTAMKEVNDVRVNRFDKKTPAALLYLTANNSKDALKKVLLERRRELPFTQRFFDIKRFNNNNNPDDDVVLTRRNYHVDDKNGVANSGPLEDYKMAKKDKRFARPIPSDDISDSHGIVKQNRY